MTAPAGRRAVRCWARSCGAEDPFARQSPRCTEAERPECCQAARRASGACDLAVKSARNTTLQNGTLVAEWA